MEGPATTMTTDAAPEVMTMEEVAVRLRCSVRTVQRLLTNGDLEGTRVGNSWRVTSLQLTRYLEAQSA